MLLRIRFFCDNQKNFDPDPPYTKNDPTGSESMIFFSAYEKKSSAGARSYMDPMAYSYNSKGSERYCMSEKSWPYCEFSD